ncbi:MAG TPA: hypothetical protein VKX40_07050 [Aequorivita sp.]|nr:hypothetical protein [Aequorivita sp.]
MTNETNSSFETNPPSSSVEEGKMTAIIAYITLIGLIIAFVMNNDKKNTFAAFHIRQALGLGLTSLALSVINIIPILGWLISLFGFLFILVLWIIGLIGAVSGEEKLVPILGAKYQEWFKTIG